MLENILNWWKMLISTKVPILKEVNFGKVKLWDVEHFWTLFVFTFGRDCYCIQQSRPKMKTKSVKKCSTFQSFTLPKWHSFKIGALGVAQKHICNIIEEIVFRNCTFLLLSKTISSIMFQICFRVSHSQNGVFKISKIIQNFD